MNDLHGTKTKLFFEWHAAKLSAAVTLHHKPEVCAAFSMLFLNHHARSGYEGEFAIYQLKNQFVKLLYALGYCRSTKIEKQTLPCNNCDESGITRYGLFRGLECARCNGTHIYREHLLFAFHFVVDDVDFLWHQPVALVDWLKQNQSEVNGVYTARDNLSTHLSRPELVKSFAVVYLFLQRHGIKPAYEPAPNPLRWCVRYDVKHFLLRAGISSRINSCRYHLVQAWRALVAPNDIPF